jgi:hypothetical protein
MKNRYFILLLLLWIPIFSTAQKAKNFSFQIENEELSTYPELSIDFSFYKHASAINLKEAFDAGVLSFMENGSIPDSLRFSPLTDSLKYNLFIIADHPSKKDSTAILNNIDRFSQFSDEKAELVQSWLIAEKNHSLQYLTFTEVNGLTRRDTFSYSISDTLFLDFLSENKLLTGNTILLFILNDADVKRLSKLPLLLENSSKANQPLFCFLNLSETPLAVDSVRAILKNHPFVIKNGVLDRKKEDVTMAPLIEAWMNRNYRLQYTTLHPLKMEAYKNYRLTLQNDSITDTISFHLNIPLQLVEEYYKQEQSRRIHALIESGRLEEAMHLIIETDSKLKIQGMDSLAWHVTGKFGQQLAEDETDNSLARYLAFERLWPQEPPADYTSTRINLFKNFFLNLKKQPEHFEEKIKLAGLINQLEPSAENKFNLPLENALWLQAQNKDWEAIETFHQALQIKNDSEVNRLLKEQLLTTFKNDFNQKNYFNLSGKGGLYKNWYSEPFRQNYILGEAYRNTHEYIKAQQQFDWLIANWQNQSFIDWFTAFEKLQELLCLNLEFDTAIELNKRLYRSKDNQEAIELSLFNSRAKYLKPVIDVFPETAKRMGSFSQLMAAVSLNTVTTPGWLCGITLTDSKMNLISALYKTDGYKTKASVNLDNYRDFPVVITDIPGNNFWLVNRLGINQFVVFHVANQNRTIQEKTFLDAITKSKMDETLWINLFRLQERTGLKYTAQLLSALWEAELSKTGNLAFQTYWNKIKENDFVKYLVYHPAPGNVQSAGSPASLTNYPAGDYERSSKTVAYFEQIIKEGNKSLYDIANPFFKNTEFKGVVRMGFETYLE